MGGGAFSYCADVALLNLIKYKDRNCWTKDDEFITYSDYINPYVYLAIGFVLILILTTGYFTYKFLKNKNRSKKNNQNPDSIN